MGFVSTVFKGAGAVAVILMVGGGIKGCIFKDNPDNATPTEKFTKESLKTGEDLVTGTGKYLEDPETQKNIEEGTERAMNLATDTFVSGMKGVTRFFKGKPFDRKDNRSANNEEPQNDQPAEHDSPAP
jgi:hypothetical protein